jgi:hypothetical protein
MCEWDEAAAEMEEWEREEAAAYVKFQKDYAEAKAKYPNACTSCGGAGMVYSTYDPSPAGISLGSGSMTDADPCAKCVEQDVCPRCGEKGINWIEGTDAQSGLSDDHFECPHCMWNELTATAVLPDW